MKCSGCHETVRRGEDHVQCNQCRAVFCYNCFSDSRGVLACDECADAYCVGDGCCDRLQYIKWGMRMMMACADKCYPELEKRLNEKLFNDLVSQEKLATGMWVAIAGGRVLIQSQDEQDAIDAAFDYLSYHSGAHVLIRCVGEEERVEKIR